MLGSEVIGFSDKLISNPSHFEFIKESIKYDLRGDIRNYYPDAVSIISVGMNYFNGHNQEDLKSDYKFSNYAWGDDYHEILKKKLFQLLNWMKENVPDLEGIVLSLIHI